MVHWRAAVLVLVGSACGYQSALDFDDGSSTVLDPNDDAPETCRNGVRDSGEADVDCSGPCAPCADGKQCGLGADCTSQVCRVTCQVATTSDGVKNGAETGVDCGGSKTAPLCADGQGCKTSDDCADHVCSSGTCFPPGAADGVKNGDETDVDCGGPAAPPCANGKGCANAGDCTSNACSTASATCVPGTAIDGVKNATETDVDCGGPDATVPRCAAGGSCAAAGDCQSAVCTAQRCQPATGTDGVKNGDETAIDCGGLTTGAKRCPAGQACVTSDDCELGCDFRHVCVDSRTCTRLRGGVTCGPGETDAVGPQESCCAMGDAVPLGGKQYLLEKYLVTAGRMRAMIEALDGDFRSWIEQHQPAWWQPAWSANLPTNKFDAEQGVGPYGLGVRRGCSYSDTGGTSARTYDTDSDITGSDGKPDRAKEVGRDYLDEKPLNCVTVYFAMALCAYDGRQLANTALSDAAIAGADARKYPWGNTPVPSATKHLTVQKLQNYLTGGSKGDFAYSYPPNAQLENTRAISAPGRMSAGAGPYGHFDLLGDMLKWDSPGKINWTYDWEGHARQVGAKAYGNEAYHAISFRCMTPR